jgi:hypothetical protein
MMIQTPSVNKYAFFFPLFTLIFKAVKLSIPGGMVPKKAAEKVIKNKVL